MAGCTLTSSYTIAESSGVTKLELFQNPFPIVNRILAGVPTPPDSGKDSAFFSVQRLIALARSFIMPVSQLHIDEFD